MKKILYPAFLITFSGSLLLNSCVSAKRYKATLFELQSLRNDSISLASKLTELQSKVSSLKQQISNLNSNVSDLSNKAGVLSNDAANNQSQLSKSQQELIKQQKRLLQLQAMLDEQTKATVEIRKKMADALSAIFSCLCQSR